MRSTGARERPCPSSCALIVRSPAGAVSNARVEDDIAREITTIFPPANVLAHPPAIEQASRGRRVEVTAAPIYSKPGGGTNAWNSRSSSFAKWIDVRSPYCGATICTPTGSPARVNPQGDTVAGRYIMPEYPAQNS